MKSQIAIDQPFLEKELVFKDLPSILPDAPRTTRLNILPAIAFFASLALTIKDASPKTSSWLPTLMLDSRLPLLY